MVQYKMNRDKVIEQILHALEGLEYGSVNITVHDAQITQIDRIEKHRFTLAPSLEKSKLPSKVSRR